MTLKEFKPAGVTGEHGEHEDMFYRFDLTGPDGAHYDLLREEHHTSEDVKRAKAYLRAHFDVVSIQVIRETVEKEAQS